MKRLSAPALSLVLGLAVALGGCGGGGATADNPQLPRLSKELLAEEMGDICQEHTDLQVVEIEKFEKKHDLPASSREAVPPSQLEKELVVVMLPIVRDTIRDLRRELRPPEAEEEKFEAFLAALEDAVEYSEKNPSWLPTGSTEPFSEARELTAELGTPYCGQA